MKNSGIEKAAMLMMALNQETASKVLTILDDDEIKDISQSMSRLGKVPTEMIEKLIYDFHSEFNETLSLVGNVENTEKFLKKVLDKDKVDAILEDIRGPAGRNIWDKLGNINEETLCNFLRNEHPQTVALVITKLSSQQASKVLALFDEEFSFEVIKRMLAMGSIKKEVLERVEKILRTEFISNITKTQKQDNNSIVAEIFNNFDRSNEAKFMEKLEIFNENSADNVKRLMFTFEDLIKINTEGIQAILKIIDKGKLALALKGANEKIRSLFIDNMSQRASKILLEEIEGMGPVKLKDVDEAQLEIIIVAKELLSKGEIEIASDGDEEEQMVY